MGEVVIDIYQMPERLGGDWAYRIGEPLFLIADGFASEQEARDAATRAAVMAVDERLAVTTDDATTGKVDE